MHTFKWADDLFYRLNQSAALNSGLSLHSKRGLGTTTEHRREAYITFRQCVASYHEKKYNKIKLGIFLIKLQDCSGRTECCICTALHQTKIPSTDKMAVILSTILPPIKKKKSWKMQEHLMFCILLHTPGYHLFLEITFCSLSHVAMDASRGRGQLSLNLPSSFTNQHTFECSDLPQTPIQIFLCFLPLSGLPNTGGFCHSPTCHSSGHAMV